MSFAHAPLNPTELGAAAKMVAAEAPPAMRLTVARGLAPLPGRDLVCALYQLWVGSEPEYSEEAAKTASSLPPPMVAAAVDDPNIPPGVLDFLSRKLVRQPALLEKILRHPKADDETLIGIARVGNETVCELLADNQERWIRAPSIVVGLYYNRNCRMSTIHRVLEFADRHGVDVKLPMMEEIRHAMRGEAQAGQTAADPGRDDLFRDVVADDGRQDEELLRVELARPEESTRSAEVDASVALAALEPEKPDPAVVADDVQPDPAGDSAGLLPDPDDPEAAAKLLALLAAEAIDPEEAAEPAAVGRERRLIQLMKMRPSEKIRAAMLGDAFDRNILVRDSNKVVAMATIKSPKMKENEVVVLAANRSLSHDVVRYIASRRDWVKLYSVKLNLVMNPKTPMSRAMTILSFLNHSDVQKVGRSKSVSSALATAARRKLANRK